MYQIVLDTNVLVAALRSKNGASYRLLHSLGDGRWRPNLTVPVVLEYEAVLKRNCREFGLPKGTWMTFWMPSALRPGYIVCISFGGPSLPIRMTT
jgi:hypothetical protein